MNSSGGLLTRFPLLLLFLFAFLPSTAKAEFLHTVKAGECLYGIARKYHVSAGRIQEANKLPSEKIHPGQRLIIPDRKTPSEGMSKKGGGVKSEAQREKGLVSEVPESHVVKKGETLFRIARRYNLSVRNLQEINQLQGGRLKAGEILLLQREADEEIEAEERETDGAGGVERTVALREKVGGNGFLADEKDRELLVRVAKSFLGARYCRGGTSINGMDCSAFVQKIFRVFDIELPRTAREQFQVGIEVAREALKTGDLVFFRRGQARHPTHVGIYIGDDQFIHTSLRSRRVAIDNLGKGYFSNRFIGGKRIEEGI